MNKIERLEMKIMIDLIAATVICPVLTKTTYATADNDKFDSSTTNNRHENARTEFEHATSSNDGLSCFTCCTISIPPKHGVLVM